VHLFYIPFFLISYRFRVKNKIQEFSFQLIQRGHTLLFAGIAASDNHPHLDPSPSRGRRKSSQWQKMSPILSKSNRIWIWNLVLFYIFDISFKSPSFLGKKFLNFIFSSPLSRVLKAYIFLIVTYGCDYCMATIIKII